MRQRRAFPADWDPPRAEVVSTAGGEVAGNLRDMADQSTQSIVINADPKAIMDVIADFSAYPQWALAVKKAEVIVPGVGDRAERVRFLLDAGLVKDEYVLEYVWSADGLTVSWELVEGQMQKAQHGSYVLEPLGAATKVTYSLAVDLAIPMIGMIKRKAEKVIMDTALKELKRRVEL
jgi:Polyketide cyclase / dehydrase and lipid transport